jgi:hypothetical protein
MFKGWYVKGSNLEDDERERILGYVQRIELSGGRVGRVCSEYSEAPSLDEEICTTQSVGGTCENEAGD